MLLVVVVRTMALWFERTEKNRKGKRKIHEVEFI